jgi:hypothetical protein
MLVTKCHKGPRTSSDSLAKRPKANGHEIWYVECKKSVQGRLAHDS